MLGCIALGKKSLTGTDSSAMKYLDDAESTALKARGLAEQLLTFAKGGEPVKSIISVTDMLNLSADFILSGTRITSSKNFSSDLKFIEADETQVSQVISNILLNAVQAMQGGGEIIISAANVTLGSGNSYALPDGEYVEITIEDQGPGIDGDVLARIFDPFFTTRSDGSGLGLSVAYSVVRKHGGGISAYNSSRGAVFRFVIPASNAEPGVSENRCIDEICFSGKVLLMDDDEMIRMVGEELLSSFGFDVVSASEGESAVEIFKSEIEKGGAFKFVVLDLTIKGGAGGLETFREMRKIDPEVTGIVSSGYSHDPVMSNFMDYGFTAVLKKPYNFDELRDIVSRISSH
jgi:CheY-like chemotaxis protein/anti-sigma regulatory factor (Ser/Thr protein kinase)